MNRKMLGDGLKVDLRSLLVGCMTSLAFMQVNVAIAADDPCATQRDTTKIDACAKRKLDEAERDLNQTYNAVIDALGHPDGLGRPQDLERKNLIKAQRYWVQFRESNCYVVLLRNADGSVSTSQHLACMEELAEQRTIQLKKWFLDK